MSTLIVIYNNHPEGTTFHNRWPNLITPILKERHCKKTTKKNQGTSLLQPKTQEQTPIAFKKLQHINSNKTLKQHLDPLTLHWHEAIDTKIAWESLEKCYKRTFIHWTLTNNQPFTPLHKFRYKTLPYVLPIWTTKK